MTTVSIVLLSISELAMAPERVVYTMLNPIVDEFWHIPSGIGSASSGSTNVISAH